MTDLIRLQWSEQEPVIEILIIDELTQILERIRLTTNPEFPTIVFVEAHGYRVVLGMGVDESFLQFEPESGGPPYLVTVGNAGAKGSMLFYLFGIHQTEILRCHLIPVLKARQILLEWIQKAIRPTDVEWEEI